MAKITVPNGKKFVEDVESLYNDIEDLKTIFRALPQNMLTIENTNKFEELLNPIRLEATDFLMSLSDKPRTYDFFKGGAESKTLCRIVGISEDDLYKCIKFLNEIVKFDVKEFVINIKRKD